MYTTRRMKLDNAKFMVHISGNSFESLESVRDELVQIVQVDPIRTPADFVGVFRVSMAEGELTQESDSQ